MPRQPATHAGDKAKGPPNENQHGDGDRDALRQLGADSIAADRLRSRATALGVDWVHTWARRNYRWMGSMVASDVGGTPQAIALTQRSSVHYFQRPDRQVIDGGFFGARYDTTAMVMRGWGLYTRVAKEQGNWL